MTPATVLSLHSESEWQSAGNQNLNTRVCSVMETASGYPLSHEACICVSFTGSQHFDPTGACKHVLYTDLQI